MQTVRLTSLRIWLSQTRNTTSIRRRSTFQHGARDSFDSFEARPRLGFMPSSCWVRYRAVVLARLGLVWAIDWQLSVKSDFARDICEIAYKFGEPAPGAPGTLP